jgi:hypothetical protein
MEWVGQEGRIRSTGAENHLIRQEWYGTPRLDGGAMLTAFGDHDAGTHAEWRIHPTVLLIAFDSEKAWCPHSWAVKSQLEDVRCVGAPEIFTYR